MIKTNKLFKKVLCAVTAGTMALTAISSVAFAEGETTVGYDKTTVIDTIDGEGTSANGKLTYSKAAVFEIDKDKAVNAIKNGEGPLLYTSAGAKTEMAAADKYIISFDININPDFSNGTAASIYFFSNETPVNPENPAQKENKGRTGYMSIKNGAVGFCGLGNATSVSSFEVANGEWINIEYVIYPQKAENDQNIIKWYINGDLAKTGRIATYEESWYQSTNRIVNNVYLTQVKQNSVRFKNFKLSTVNAKSTEYNTVSARVNEDGNIIADFTDRIENEYIISGIKIYGEDGTKLERTITMSEDKKSMTIVPEQKLGSFTVSFPERFVSASGLSLKESVLKADGFQPVQVVKENGTAYAKTELLNTAANDKKVNIALASYKTANSGLEMLGYTTKTVTVPANSKTVVDTTGDNAVALEVAEGATIVKGFMWDGTANTALKDATVDGTNVNNLPENTGFVQVGASEMTLSDDFGTENANSNVTVVVSDKDNNVVYADQVKADESGKAGLYFSVNGDFLSKELSAVMVPSAGVKKTYSISYKNASLYDNAANEINNAIADDAKTETEVVKLIQSTMATDYSYFGVDKALFEGADQEDAAKLIYNELTKDENSRLPVFGDEANFDNMEKGAGLIKKLYIMTAVGNQKISNLFDYSDGLNLKDDVNYTWYTKDYVSDIVKSDITARMAKDNISKLTASKKAVSGTNYTSQEQFYTALKSAYILSVVKAPNGEDNSKEVLDHFREDNTLDIPEKLKTSTYTSLKNVQLNSLSELEDKIEELEKENGGGGGSSTRPSNSKPNSNSGNKNSGSSMVFGEGTSVPAPEKVPDTIYTDMKGYEWAEQAVIYLTEKRVVNGKSETEFAPADLITREEFAAMLVRAFANDIEAAEVSFSDADKDEWYNEYLGKAVAAGFVNGYDDGSFGVGENITRQDMVVMTSRAAKYAGIMLSGGAYTTFGDDADIADYAKDAVYEMKTAGIVNGVSERQFSPLDNAERAQAAKVVFELLNV